MRNQALNLGVAVMLLVSTLLVFAGTANAYKNLPTDTGNYNAASNGEWENALNHSSEPVSIYVDPNMVIQTGDSKVYTSANAATFRINNNLTIEAGASLTFRDVTVIMNGSAPDLLYGGTLTVEGTLILINSTLDMNLGYINITDASMILDNSSIVDAGRIRVLATSAGSNFYAFNSDVETLAVQCTSNVASATDANMYFINTEYDLGAIAVTDGLTGEAFVNFGYQHYLYMPTDDADATNRTFAIRDYRGNTTQTNWAATIGGLNFETYLHMDDHLTDGVISFGTTECIITDGGLAVDDVFTYGISYAGNGTTGINVTVDYPDDWFENSIEVYNHTTSRNVQFRGMSAELPYFEAPYTGEDSANDTGRTEISALLVVIDSANNERTFPMLKTESVEINHAGIVASAGADVEVELGDTITLTGTVLTERSSALTYFWQIFDDSWSVVLDNVSGRTGTVEINATEYEANSTYYAVFTVTNGEGSYDTDTKVITTTEEEADTDGATGGDDEDEEEGRDWTEWDSYDFWHQDFWTDLWAEVEDFWYQYYTEWYFWAIIGLVLVLMYFIWPAYADKLNGIWEYLRN